MKKLLLILLLTIFSNGAMARWEFLTMTNELDVYVDIAYKQKLGKKVEIWTLHDFKSIKTNSAGRLYLSKVMQHEYDFFNKTSTLISFAQYTYNMQVGSVVDRYTFPPEETINDSILPNSISEIMFEKACGKK